MKLSIGIDVSKKTLDVVFFNGESFIPYNFLNNQDGIQRLIQEILKYREYEVIITMEATGVYHLNLANQLYAQGYTVSVMNPLVIKRFSEMKMVRAKTDSVDARVIAQFGFEQNPYIYTPKPDNCQGIVYYLKAIEDLLHLKTQNSNRIEALSCCNDAPRGIVESLRKVNECITMEIKEAEKAIKNIIKQHNQEQYQRLKKIPGIGDRTSSAIIGYFNEFECFETAKQVVSFIGVNPSPRISGTSVRGRGAISRKGNKYLRKLFYMAALSASRHNHSCEQLYNRMLLKGKDKKLALTAVANKLIRQVFAIVKYKREYIYQY
ncbi:IS110 family transposase [Candidatus Dependentiae bacterium]|nr:IS110 family transposase [Candidatus Dependentiae bacterium]MBU4387884.1 IS110 family transposase [Candidatus Dependentiae bacterium]